MQNYQLTLALIKPHAVKNPFTLAKVEEIILKNFKIIERTNVQITTDLADRFYGEHKTKFFFNRLHSSMCSGRVEALIISGENAIAKWRGLLGPTKVFRTVFTHPSTVRGQFGLSDTRNICHGSDSSESVKREIAIFFPTFNVDQWYRLQHLQRQVHRALK